MGCLCRLETSGGNRLIMNLSPSQCHCVNCPVWSHFQILNRPFQKENWSAQLVLRAEDFISLYETMCVPIDILTHTHTYGREWGGEEGKRERKVLTISLINYSDMSC